MRTQRRPLLYGDEEARGRVKYHFFASLHRCARSARRTITNAAKPVPTVPAKVMPLTNPRPRGLLSQEASRNLFDHPRRPLAADPTEDTGAPLRAGQRLTFSVSADDTAGICWP